MKKLFFLSLIISFSIGAFAQNDTKSSTETAVAFEGSDGCSMFPDGAYLDCCVKHDKAYFSGGSWLKRWKADRNLFKCVARKRGWYHKLIAPLMWSGVRVGGVSWLPTSFRWGFGRIRKSSK